MADSMIGQREVGPAFPHPSQNSAEENTGGPCAIWMANSIMGVKEEVGPAETTKIKRGCGQMLSAWAHQKGVLSGVMTGRGAGKRWKSHRVPAVPEITRGEALV